MSDEARTVTFVGGKLDGQVRELCGDWLEVVHSEPDPRGFAQPVADDEPRPRYWPPKLFSTRYERDGAVMRWQGMESRKDFGPLPGDPDWPDEGDLSDDDGPAPVFSLTYDPGVLFTREDVERLEGLATEYQVRHEQGGGPEDWQRYAWIMNLANRVAIIVAATPPGQPSDGPDS